MQVLYSVRHLRFSTLRTVLIPLLLGILHFPARTISRCSAPSVQTIGWFTREKSTACHRAEEPKTSPPHLTAKCTPTKWTSTGLFVRSKTVLSFWKRDVASCIHFLPTITDFAKQIYGKGSFSPADFQKKLRPAILN